MKLTCIKDVIMETGEKAFTKDQQYKGYKSTVKDCYYVVPVLRAKNDLGERHIIKYLKKEDLDNFFNRHFKSAL